MLIPAETLIVTVTVTVTPNTNGKVTRILGLCDARNSIHMYWATPYDGAPCHCRIVSHGRRGVTHMPLGTSLSIPIPTHLYGSTLIVTSTLI